VCIRTQRLPEYYGLQGEVKTASGEATKSDGVGKLKLYSHGLHPMGGFENVVFCKSVTEKLASVGELCDAGMVCVFDKHSLKTYREDRVEIKGVATTNDKRDPTTKLYPLTLLRKKGETVYNTTTNLATICVQPARAQAVYVQPNWGELPESIDGGVGSLPQALLAKVYVKPGLDEVDRYHAKFGDIGVRYLKRCLPNLKIPTQYRCEVCIDGKIHKFGHKACAEGMRTQYLPGVCIHTDHSGPYARSLSGARYSQLYLDRGSGYLWGVRQKKTGHYDSTPQIFTDAWGL
jgi:hypothetical protein